MFVYFKLQLPTGDILFFFNSTLSSNVSAICDRLKHKTESKYEGQLIILLSINAV